LDFNLAVCIGQAACNMTGFVIGGGHIWVTIARAIVTQKATNMVHISQCENATIVLKPGQAQIDDCMVDAPFSPLAAMPHSQF